MGKKYSISTPLISKNEIREVQKVLKSGWLTYGPKTIELEKIVKKKIKTKNVIAVNSATSGIFIVLKALNAKQGDEVITPSNTYISTINTLFNMGLKIVLCDVNKSTGNVDEGIFKKKITKKTKFFIPVHNGGNPLDLPKLLNIAKKFNIKIIDDAATAFGAKLGKKYIGSFNNATTVFSLHANKIITSGEGGFISTNNNKLAKKIRILTNSGLSKDTWLRKRNSKNYRILNAVMPGYKLNFNDILSSIAIEQIKKIEKIINFRRKLYLIYLKKLKKLILTNKIYIPKFKNNFKSAYYNFPIIILGKKNFRNQLADHLQKKNIFTTIHYTPAHKHDFYKKKFNNFKLPNTDSLFLSSLSLPLHNKLNLKDIEFITKQILNFFDDKK